MYFPSLSESGWLTSSARIADALLAHMLISNYSQSQIYAGSVSSMAYVIEQGQGDIPKTISLLENTLSTYLKRFFDQVSIEIKQLTITNKSSNVSLTMYIGLTDSLGDTITLDKLISSVNGSTYKMVNLNNTGT
jgi:hypothetical protein